MVATDSDNVPALRVYEKTEFRPIEVGEPRWYEIEVPVEAGLKRI
jgi:hypothetical protein